MLTLAGVGAAALALGAVGGFSLRPAPASDAQPAMFEIATPGVGFAPFFFAVAGAAVDLRALFVPELAALAIGLAMIGVVTKLGAGFLIRRRGRWTAITVGAGMVPRGEVGIIVADIGLVAGVLAADLFSAVIVAVVLTTVTAPVLLQRAIPRALAEESGP